MRYDGGHKLDNSLISAFGPSVEWMPVCPEAESGLPVPREAMRLTGEPDNPRLVTLHTGLDHTDRIVKWSREKVELLRCEALCGFIFKSKSPSSGMRDIEVCTISGALTGFGAGIFARIFMNAFPLLPVEDEDRLRDPIVLAAFMKKIFEGCDDNVLY